MFFDNIVIHTACTLYRESKKDMPIISLNLASWGTLD